MSSIITQNRRTRRATNPPALTARRTLSFAAALALVVGTQTALSATLDDPDTVGSSDGTAITAVPTGGDPLDLPGRGPAPKTKSENALPPPVQSGARPEKTPDPREWFGSDGKPWLEWSRATGDWGGTRTSMEAAGITFAGSIRADFFSNLSGGRDTTGFSRMFVDANLTFDLDPLTGGAWKGGSVYADFYNYSGEKTDPTGSVQGTDLLTISRNVNQLGELWFQQVLFDGVLRVKAGKIDANVDFAALPCATGFISANGSWDPALIEMPTYPDPATGVLAFYTPNDCFYCGAGCFDGATHDGIHTGSSGPATFFSDSRSDSWYLIGEAGLNWKQLGSLAAGRAYIGGWYHSGDFVRFDSTTADGTGGLYLAAQQQLITRGEGDEQKDKGLFAFARAAFADDSIATIRTHVSAGLVTKGTFEGRDSDEAGLMWSFADLSPDSGTSGNESIVELYYGLALAGSVTVTPNFQWVHNPGGDPTLDDAVLIGLSVKLSF